MLERDIEKAIQKTAFEQINIKPRLSSNWVANNWALIFILYHLSSLLTCFFKAYHCKCVDPWLTEGKRTCPVCKRPVSNDRRSRARNRRDRNDVESGSGETTHDADETTPLIGSTSASVASNSLTV